MAKFLTLTGLEHVWSAVKERLNSKVDKVDGKGLSTNDLTTALKSSYDAAYTHSISEHAPAQAQENVIESVKVDGTALSITNKAVNIDTSTIFTAITNDEIDQLINQ